MIIVMFCLLWGLAVWITGRLFSTNNFFDDKLSKLVHRGSWSWYVISFINMKCENWNQYQLVTVTCTHCDKIARRSVLDNRTSVSGVSCASLSYRTKGNLWIEKMKLLIVVCFIALGEYSCVHMFLKKELRQILKG